MCSQFGRTRRVPAKQQIGESIDQCNNRKRRGSQHMEQDILELERQV